MASSSHVKLSMRQAIDDDIAPARNGDRRAATLKDKALCVMFGSATALIFPQPHPFDVSNGAVMKHSAIAARLGYDELRGPSQEQPARGARFTIRARSGVTYLCQAGGSFATGNNNENDALCIEVSRQN